MLIQTHAMAFLQVNNLSIAIHLLGCSLDLGMIYSISGQPGMPTGLAYADMRGFEKGLLIISQQHNPACP